MRYGVKITLFENKSKKILNILSHCHDEFLWVLGLKGVGSISEFALGQTVAQDDPRFEKPELPSQRRGHLRRTGICGIEEVPTVQGDS